MTRLMQEIHDDPEAVFEFAADLPSGNRMTGTVGPMIGGRLAVAITFRDSPASEQDIQLAQYVMDKAVGETAATAMVSDTPAEHAESLAAMRKFMGGGQG